MSRRKASTGFLTCLAFLIHSPAFSSHEIRGGPPSQVPAMDSTQSRLADAYGALPMVFEPNRGQSDPAVKFLARGTGYRTLLTADSAFITLRENISPGKCEVARTIGSRTIKMRFVGANPAPALSGEAMLAGEQLLR